MRYVRSAKPLFVETPLWDGVEPHRPNLQVSENQAADTGLLWPTGERIMRVSHPIGFGRNEEWN